MYRLGIDLGGTNIAVAVVDENYNIVSLSDGYYDSKYIYDTSKCSSKIMCDNNEDALLKIKSMKLAVYIFHETKLDFPY